MLRPLKLFFITRKYLSGFQQGIVNFCCCATIMSSLSGTKWGLCWGQLPHFQIQHCHHCCHLKLHLNLFPSTPTNVNQKYHFCNSILVFIVCTVLVIRSVIIRTVLVLKKFIIKKCHHRSCENICSKSKRDPLTYHEWWDGLTTPLCFQLSHFVGSLMTPMQ